MFDSLFCSPANARLQREMLLQSLDTLFSAFPPAPYSGLSASSISALLPPEPLPRTGVPFAELLDRLRPIVANSISLAHPNTVAHLHPPALLASLAAELILSSLNQSMDSFDQAPSATALELQLSRWLCDEAGYPPSSDAVFTSGATQSNFMGLLLARDVAVSSHFHRSARRSGLSPEAHRLRFLCSEVAHFTVEKSVTQLGLGSDSVIKLPVDSSFRMDLPALEFRLAELRREGLIPAAIVATAGSTDFGSMDPLAEISSLARAAGAWFHVDAAYGSALLLSSHRHLLRGLELADSLSMDFHKCFWQSISCGAFLLRDASHFQHLELHADYLNPEHHDASGIPNLVNRSLSTTRRFDALKLWFSFQILGRDTFVQLVDRTLALARHAASLLRSNPAFELLHEPQFGCVVFRVVPSQLSTNADALNSRLRQHLFDRGLAVLGHTVVRGRQCLKFTFMNPATSDSDVASLLALIASEARQIEQLTPSPS